VIRILTYHKISAGTGTADPDFYSVSEAAFREQLGLLHRRGMIGVAPELVVSPPGTGSASFLLCFDDGTLDHFEVVRPILRELKLRGVFFVPTSKLDRPGYLTRKQLAELAGDGHVLGLHGHEHKRLDVESGQFQAGQLETASRILAEASGGAPWIFAPPGGFIDEPLRQVAIRQGVRAIRTMRWGHNRRLRPHALQTIPVNRHVDIDRFEKLLDPGMRGAAYAGKELLKLLVPSAAYESLRRMAFRISNRN
jgi:peptidoglycan/xylan/chitin deacetylase (PgdA/CDA1 family)